MGGLGPMQGQANHFKLMAGAKSEYGIKRYIDETKRLLGVIDDALEGREYLVGPGSGKYSIADIASYCWANYAKHLDIEVPPNVAAWCAKISDREAVKRGKAVPSGGKTDEELSEMFSSMAKKIDAMENTDKH